MLQIHGSVLQIPGSLLLIPGSLLLSLYIHSYRLLHFVQWRRLADDGGDFTSPFSMACRSKEMARGMVKKKPEAVRPELDFNPIRRVFFPWAHGAFHLDYGLCFYPL